MISDTYYEPLQISSYIQLFSQLLNPFFSAPHTLMRRIHVAEEHTKGWW